MNNKEFKKRLEQHRKRLESLKKIRKPVEERWGLIGQNLIPSRELLLDSWDTEGSIIGSKIYDGYALQQAYLMANGIFGYTCSASMNWFNVMMRKPELNRIKRLRQYMQERAEQMRYAINRSNFYAQVPAFLVDGVTLATATTLVEEDTIANKINFSTRHPYEVFLAKDAFGNYDTHYREFEDSVHAINGRWPDKLPKELLDTPDEKIKVYHAVTRRVNYDNSGFNTKFKYESFYWVEEGDDGIVLSDSGYKTNPYITWAYRTDSNETYGRGPADDVLNDVRWLHVVAKTELNTVHKASNPTMDVPIEWKDSYTNKPGGRNYYYNDPNKRAYPEPAPNAYPLQYQAMDRRRQIIDQAFMKDLFLMLASARREMTATEIIEKQAERISVIGPALGGFNSQALGGMLRRVNDIEQAAGRMPEVPGELEQYLGEEMAVDYLGPLAQAQKKQFGTRGIMQTINELRSVADITPQVYQRFNWDKIAEQVAEDNSMPEDCLYSDEEMAQMAAAQQAAAKEQQEMANLESMGKAAKGLNQPIADDSLLAKMKEK